MSEIGGYADKLREYDVKFKDKGIDFISISLAKTSDSTWTATHKERVGQGATTVDALEDLLKLV